MLSKVAWILLLLAFETASAKALFAQEPFYKGKTIRMIVGFSAGGGFDTYARVRGLPDETTLMS
jgi:tripartite-type tricarboxylate transporter receptor subunit TctC